MGHEKSMGHNLDWMVDGEEKGDAWEATPNERQEAVGNWPGGCLVDDGHVAVDRNLQHVWNVNGWLKEWKTL